MAHKGTSQGQMHLMDEHGNRVDQIDEPNATQGMAMGFAPAGTGTDAMKKDHHDEGQQLRRSGSSSSSSSEDDGEGGRRKKKKAIKEKIKDTLAGGESADQDVQTTAAPTPTPTPTSTSTGEVKGGEKKRMMEKIKEKIPGMH